MVKSKLVLRLGLYFAVILLIFALLMGGIYLELFRRHTTTIHKSDLLSRGQSIAKTLSSYLNTEQGEPMRGNGYGAYLRAIGDIAGADAWVVNHNLQLLSAGHAGHSNCANDGTLSSPSIPHSVSQIVHQVLLGETLFSEDFSAILSDPTLTVGVPILAVDGRVLGAVLLHAPVKGIQSAVRTGWQLMLSSLVVALGISLLISLWLSGKFAKPILSQEEAQYIRLDKVRQDFVANISHELKTPIAVLRGSLEALVDRVVTDPVKVGQYYHQMLFETLYLQRLVGDLLDLSRLQSEDFSLDKAPLSFAHVVQDALHSVQPLALKKNIALVAEIEQSDGLLEGDYGRLRQLLLILLDNAVKFSPAEGQVTLTLKGRKLMIADCGAGIPPADLPFVFERFYHSRSEQNKSGTGLGLPIAQQIAQRHGMTLTAQNKVEGGALFTLLLPE